MGVGGGGEVRRPTQLYILPYPLRRHLSRRSGRAARGRIEERVRTTSYRAR